MLLGRRMSMLQNLKNFLIAFITGLIVFGVCALIIINFGMRAISGASQSSDALAEDAQQTVSQIE